MIYDYRVRKRDVNDIATQLDGLSEKQLLKIAEVVEEMKQSDDEIYHISKRNYFDRAILPILQDFAEITSSLLDVSEKQDQIVEALFKNTYGFDITESCKYMKMLFLLANHIGISLEEEEVILSVIFDFRELQ